MLYRLYCCATARRHDISRRHEYLLYYAQRRETPYVTTEIISMQEESAAFGIFAAAQNAGDIRRCRIRGMA